VWSDLSEFWTVVVLNPTVDSAVTNDLGRFTAISNRAWHSACQELIRSFVSPTVDECESLITSFHFLFEPHLLFRLRCKDESARLKVEGIVADKFRQVAPIVREMEAQFSHDYHGEADDYGGEDNWLVVEKFLEASSRFFIRRATDRSGRYFSIWKLVHIFLNCNNFQPPFEESRSLVAIFCERMQYRGVAKDDSRRWLCDVFDEHWDGGKPPKWQVLLEAMPS